MIAPVNGDWFSISPPGDRGGRRASGGAGEGSCYSVEGETGDL